MKKLALCGVLLAINSTSVLADDLKFEIDYLKLNSQLVVLDFDTSAIQLRIANSVAPNIDVEGVVAFGIGDDSYTEFDPIDGTFSISFELSNMMGVFAKAYADASPGLRLYGRVGLVQVKYSFDVASDIFGPGSESYDGTGIAFGIGANIVMDAGSAIVLEYTKLPDVDFEGLDIETDALMVGYQASF